MFHRIFIGLERATEGLDIAASHGFYAKRSAQKVVRQIAPVRLFSVRHEFPNEWAKFKSGKDLEIALKPEHYPFWTRGVGRAPKRSTKLHSLGRFETRLSLRGATFHRM